MQTERASPVPTCLRVTHAEPAGHSLALLGAVQRRAHIDPPRAGSFTQVVMGKPG
jgi:hypothetical protein